MLFFTSDLHLQPGLPGKTADFCAFVDGLVAPQNTLILGGDIFDLFLGNQQFFYSLHSPVWNALDRFGARGGRVLYFEGNHDLHLLAAARSRSYLEVASGPRDIELGSLMVHVAHGDQIDPLDRGYHFLRWLLRTRAMKELAALLPERVVGGIGRASSEASRNYNNSERLAKHEQERVRTLYKEYSMQQLARGVAAVLLGHSHLADFLPLADKNNQAKGAYINLGYLQGGIPWVELELSDGALYVRRKQYLGGLSEQTNELTIAVADRHST
jgi:UDP-2,3-diacylglucosamine hydrolase